MSNKKVRGGLLRGKSLNKEEEIKHIGDKNTSGKVRTRKLRKISDEMREDSLDRTITREDNFSIGLMIAILVGCFVVGIAVGYILYKLAIDNSNTLLIINNLVDRIM